MTFILKAITGWVLFVALLHADIKSEFLNIVYCVLMIAGMITLVCFTGGGLLTWILNENEKSLKVFVVLVPLILIGCASEPKRATQCHQDWPIFGGQSWGSTNPTNSPICR